MVKNLAPRPGAATMFRPLPSDDGWTTPGWTMPREVWLDGGYLLWRRSEVALEGDADLLRRFLDLGDGSDGDIADYAQEFGTLLLCVHDQPWHWTHYENGQPIASTCSGMVTYDHDDVASGRTRVDDPSRDTGVYRESLAAWRAMARRLRALVDVAALVDAGRASTPEHTQQLELLAHGWSYPRIGDLPRAAGMPAEEVNRAQTLKDRWDLQDAFNRLLRDSLRVRVDYSPSRHSARPTMSYGVSCLADTLVLQTALAICDADAALICDGCSAVFIPPATYRPRTGQRRFCQSCRDRGIPLKLADRDRRARARATKEGSS